MTSAKIIVLLFVTTVVGALMGIALGGTISQPMSLGIASGSAATVVAGAVRNFLVSRGALGPDYSPIPFVIIVYAIIASVIASAGAVKIDEAAGITSSIWIGATAGLLSGILLALLTISFLMGRNRS